MLTSDPQLRQFVKRLTELNKGRAYSTSPDRLGEFLLLGFRLTATPEHPLTGTRHALRVHALDRRAGLQVSRAVYRGDTGSAGGG